LAATVLTPTPNCFALTDSIVTTQPTENRDDATKTLDFPGHLGVILIAAFLEILAKLVKISLFCEDDTTVLRTLDVLNLFLEINWAY
jgi:hypothetical protein